jgi:O-antigen/teichoic acid export membrane protein
MENIRKNVIWNTAGTMIYCAAQWVITIIVVHMASYEAAGYLSLAMTTSSTFSVICLFGMRDFQISDVRGEFTPHEYTGSRILTCTAAFITCAIVAAVSNSGYQAMCIGGFMLIRVAEGIVDVLYGEDQKLDRYDLIGKSFIFRGIGLVVSFVAGMAATKDLLTSILLMAGSSLLIAIFFDCRKTAALEEIRPVVWSPKVRKLLMHCAPIVIYSFLLSAQNLTAKEVLQRAEGTTILGIYSSMASPTLVVQVFATVAFSPFIPRLSRMIEENRMESFRKSMRKVYLFYAGLAAVVQGGAMLLGRWGLKLLFGEDILSYYDAFYPIVWCTILLGCIYTMGAILVALRRIRFLCFGMIGDYLLCLLLAGPCVQRFGMNGASVVQIVCFALFIIYAVCVCEGTIAQRIKEGKRTEISP